MILSTTLWATPETLKFSEKWSRTMEQSSVATLVGFSELEFEERISSRHRAKGREKICEAIKKINVCQREVAPKKWIQSVKNRSQTERSLKTINTFHEQDQVNWNLYNKRQCPRQKNNQQQQLFFGRKFFRDNFLNGIFSVKSKVGGLDLSRRDLDRDLDLDAQKISVSTVEKISTVFKS